MDLPEPTVTLRDPVASSADPTMTVPDGRAYRPRHARPDDDVQTGYDIWPAYGAQDPTPADPWEG